MTDTLRTKIAAAIREVDDMRVCKLSDADIKFIVEAVIRELKLHVVTVGYFQTVIKGSYPTPLEENDA